MCLRHMVFWSGKREDRGNSKIAKSANLVEQRIKRGHALLVYKNGGGGSFGRVAECLSIIAGVIN
jgi:hypothetical protein